MTDEIRRQSDFERLIRIDENTKAIKDVLDRYPLPQLDERLSEQGKKLVEQGRKLDRHIDRHWMFWASIAAPVLVSIILLFVKR